MSGFIKGQSEKLKAFLSDDEFRRFTAAGQTGMFYILLVGNVICPVATILHTPKALVWILTFLIGFSLMSVLTSSPVFSRNGLFRICRWMTAISIIGNVIFLSIVNLCHVHIAPL